MTRAMAGVMRSAEKLAVGVTDSGWKFRRGTGFWRGMAMLAAMAAGLSGCAAVGGGGKALDTFDLAVPDVQAAKQRRAGVQILIAEPAALKILDSESIVIRNGGASVAYLSGAQWSDRLPKIVQTRLIQAFENSGRFGGVGRPGEGLAIDFQIITDIRAFEVAVAGSNQATVEISAKLLNDRNGVVGSSKVFTATVAAGAGNAQMVNALDSAFEKVAAEIVAWVSAKV